MKKVVSCYAILFLFTAMFQCLTAQCPISLTDFEKVLRCSPEEFKHFATANGYTIQSDVEEGISFRCNTPKDTTLTSINDELQKFPANATDPASAIFMTSEDRFRDDFVTALILGGYKLKGTETKKIEEMMGMDGTYSYYNSREFSVRILKVEIFFITLYEFTITEKVKKQK